MTLFFQAAVRKRLLLSEPSQSSCPLDFPRRVQVRTVRVEMWPDQTGNQLHCTCMPNASTSLVGLRVCHFLLGVGVHRDAQNEEPKDTTELCLSSCDDLLWPKVVPSEKVSARTQLFSGFWLSEDGG